MCRLARRRVVPLDVHTTVDALSHYCSLSLPSLKTCEAIAIRASERQHLDGDETVRADRLREAQVGLAGRRVADGERTSYVPWSSALVHDLVDGVVVARLCAPALASGATRSLHQHDIAHLQALFRAALAKVSFMFVFSHPSMLLSDMLMYFLQVRDQVLDVFLRR